MKKRWRSKHQRRNEEMEAVVQEMFAQAQARFGDLIKGTWVYSDDICPGCGGGISVMKHKGEEVLSVNAFIYRGRGVLISYVLCGRCGEYIFAEAEKDPYRQTPLHLTIEQNLSMAYERYRASMEG